MNVLVSITFGSQANVTEHGPTGVCIEYLPPYSPDLNPIEEAFSKIKAFICQYAHLLTQVGFGLLYDLMECMDIITDSDAIGYFIHAGYM